QEQNGGSISGTGFAIEDFQPLHVKRAIENGRCNRFGLGRHKCLLERVRDKRLELKEFCCGYSVSRSSELEADETSCSNAAGHDPAINIVNGAGRPAGFV